MSKKHMISLLVSLCLISLGACKKGVPTGPDDPDGDLSLELSGVITSNGNPFSNIDVYLSWGASKKTTTGADGKFSFANLISGNYIITPSKLGYAFSPSNYVLYNQTRKDLDFKAQLTTSGSGVNDIASDFTAKDQNGKDISLYNYFGKVILFDFSADWCPPCRQEASHLEDLYDEYKDKGFQVITLLIDGSPSSWSQDYNLTFPVLDDNNRTIWNIYGEGSVPLNIIVGRNCVIRYKKAGYNENEIKETIEKYL